MDAVQEFERERPRLVRLAARILADDAEAQDVVQQAWLRLDRTETEIDNLPGWLTTVTTRLCLDRLRAKVPTPVDEIVDQPDGLEPADEAALADSVGVALRVVLERLSPAERVAFVLHDTFGFEFATIAEVLDTSTVAARKLASRARAKVRRPAAEDRPARWEVVDAFMAAARGGDLEQLLRLLAPDAVVSADAAASALGTPERIEGRDAIAEFFNGSAHAALSVLHRDRPGAAWFDRGTARVLFDFVIDGGVVTAITFRADEDELAHVRRRRGADPA